MNRIEVILALMEETYEANHPTDKYIITGYEKCNEGKVLWMKSVMRIVIEMEMRQFFELMG